MVENRDNSQDNSPKNNNGLDLKSKILVVALFVFAVVIVILWANSLENNLKEPFEYKGEANTSEEGICSSGNCGDSSDEDLKNKDTDGDGLSDWEELNVYNTSPYIKDSDSDGYSDGEEVKNNKDPNCAAGSDDCTSSNFEDTDNINKPTSTNPSMTGQDLQGLSQMFGETENEASENVISPDSLDIKPENVSQKTKEELASGEVNAQNLRKLLLEAGMEKRILDQISDEDLVKSYKEAANSQ